jgi:hypothetical protein
MHIRKADEIIKRIKSVKEKHTYDANIISSSLAKTPVFRY